MSIFSLSRTLDTNGDGTGTKNANGNYSVTEDIFYIQPATNQTFDLQRIIVCIEDTNGMQAEEYGNLGSALSNGVTIRLQDDSGTLLDLTDGIPITTNASWGMRCYDADVKSWGAGDEILLVRWTFTSHFGHPLRLNGSKNERLEIVLNDDLSGLVAHYFAIGGAIVI